jgi:hypothetical protein
MPGATSETTPFKHAVNRGPSIHLQRKSPAKRAQALDIQRILKEGIEDTEEPLSSKAKAAHVWRELEADLREWSGKPKLAPIKVEPKRKRQGPPALLPGSGPGS